MYKIMFTAIALLLFVGCGDDTPKSKAKPTESSTMMMNAKMVDKARALVSQENKKTDMTLDDLEDSK